MFRLSFDVGAFRQSGGLFKQANLAREISRMSVRER
jgi:hypothetical protein